MTTYSITYKSVLDPSGQEQSILLEALTKSNIVVLDQIPGIIHVRAKKSAIKDIVQAYPKWEYSVTGNLSHC